MWQPIETAPKDGTRILAYCAGGDWQDVIYWEASWQGAPFWCSDRTKTDPTHWMPLPEPPKGDTP